MVYFYTSDKPLMLLHHIKGVAFDNDNTLYKEPDNAKEIHVQAGIGVIQEVLPWLDEQSAFSLMKKSREVYGGSLEILTREHGASPKQVRARHYKNLIELVNKTDFIEPDENIQIGLQGLQTANIPTVILTHGNMEWSEFTCQQGLISGHFNEQNIITKDHVSANKVKEPRLYEAGLDYLGAPETIKLNERGLGYAIIEDTVINLKWAKALGMTTFLVNTNLPPEDVPEYVDIIAPSTDMAINCILVSNQLHLKKVYEQEAHFET